MRLHSAAIDEQLRLGIRLPKLIDDFLPHFETTDADRRPEPNLRNGTYSTDRIDRFRGNLLRRTTPAGVNVRDDAALHVGDGDGKAVRDFDAEGGAGVGGPKPIARIAFAPLFFNPRTYDVAAMNLRTSGESRIDA